MRGRVSIVDDERSGRPKDATTDENVEIVHNLVMCDKRRDLQRIASTSGHKFLGSANNSNGYLGYVQGLGRWVPRMLTNDQTRCRLDISKYPLSRYEDDPGDFIDRVVTQDETWVHHFDPESKMQSMRWKHPCRASSAGKVMAVSVFLDSQGVIIIIYLQQGRTIMQQN